MLLLFLIEVLPSVLQPIIFGSFLKKKLYTLHADLKTKEKQANVSM